MNKRKRGRVEIVNNPETALKLLSKPNFSGYEKMADGVYAFSLKNRSVKLDTAIYSGVSILEFAKLIVYQYHYDKVLNWFGSDNVSILMSDTDSLYYQLRIKGDMYSLLDKYKNHFDFSGYPSVLKDDNAHLVKLFSNKNKKKVGKLSDDANGAIVLDFIGLAPKSYSIALKGGSKRACKGVKKQVQAKLLKHELYKEVLEKQRLYFATCKYIRPSFKNDRQGLYTTELRKIALTPLDTKRYLNDDNITTTSWGHYSLRK